MCTSINDKCTRVTVPGYVMNIGPRWVPKVPTAFHRRNYGTMAELPVKRSTFSG